MEDKLRKALEEYIKLVEKLCNNLIEHINQSKNLNLKTKTDFFGYRNKTREMEFDVGDLKYRLHGKGCMVEGKDLFVNWDFGYRSRWCGVNPWMVAETLKQCNNINVEYYEGDIIKEACEKAVESGIMFKKYDQYYFDILKENTFKPQFPSEYDTLVIKHFDLQWAVPRNKQIDRFIRKSIWISNQINDNDNHYMLKFLLKDKEIYSVPYDDISYPESAIKIMSDDILRNIKNMILK